MSLEKTTAPVIFGNPAEMVSIMSRLREAYRGNTRSFRQLSLFAQELNLSPPAFSVLWETIYRSEVLGLEETPQFVWDQYGAVWSDVMVPSIERGRAGNEGLRVLNGDWARRVANAPSAVIGGGWEAFGAAMAVQEYNAAMGRIAAAPTGGASGTVPGTIWGAAKALGAEHSVQVQALTVAGLIGLVGFRRGPVSGAQSGCGGEIGIAAGMAAGAVCFMLGGRWDQIDAAGALAASTFVGMECSPSLGRVEYPCIPRNGAAALVAIGFGQAAMAGLKPPYGLDATFDRIFTVGGLLPTALRETERGQWMGTALDGKSSDSGI